MRLLVSVADGVDALAAIEGGADVIDAKDPARGALGAVSEARLGEIVDAVAGVRPISVALGDVGLDDGTGIERLAAVAAGLGVDYVKVGFASGVSVGRAEASVGRVVAAVEGGCKVVLAACADAGPGRLDLHSVLEIATAGAGGVLLDTLDKRGRGLFDVMQPEAVATWVASAHAANLLAAVAGSLRTSDIGAASRSGADLVGVRGAVCEGGRGGRVAASRVRELVRALAFNEATESGEARSRSMLGERREWVWLARTRLDTVSRL
jgi:(5-formylfuran-3-yl)methyl phosphate synthase